MYNSINTTDLKKKALFTLTERTRPAELTFTLEVVNEASVEYREKFCLYWYRRNVQEATPTGYGKKATPKPR